MNSQDDRLTNTEKWLLTTFLAVVRAQTYEEQQAALKEFDRACDVIGFAMAERFDFNQRIWRFGSHEFTPDDQIGVTFKSKPDRQ